jgi:hypothetical protein
MKTLSKPIKTRRCSEHAKPRAASGAKARTDIANTGPARAGTIKKCVPLNNGCESQSGKEGEVSMQSVVVKVDEVVGAETTMLATRSWWSGHPGYLWMCDNGIRTRRGRTQRHDIDHTQTVATHAEGGGAGWHGMSVRGDAKVECMRRRHDPSGWRSYSV